MSTIHLYNEQRFDTSLRQAWEAFESGESIPALSARADAAGRILSRLPGTLARDHRRERLADFRSAVEARRGVLERQLFGDEGSEEDSGVHERTERRKDGQP